MPRSRQRAPKVSDVYWQPWWVEQKNGAVVRRLVGYGRLEGVSAAEGLARLYSPSRLLLELNGGTITVSAGEAAAALSHEMVGRFDLAFVTVYLLPLLVLALSYNVPLGGARAGDPGQDPGPDPLAARVGARRRAREARQVELRDRGDAVDQRVRGHSRLRGSP